ERARVGVRAVLRDFPVIDVAGELRGVLVLLVLGLERADADAILLAEEQPLAADMIGDDLAPVPLVLVHQALEDEAARGIEVALDADAELIVRELELVDGPPAPFHGDEAKRLFLHGGFELVRAAAGEPGRAEADPLEGVERPLRRARIRLEALL